MKFRVTKCCCCFNLKYGFITFAVISLIFRVISVFLLWASAQLTVAVISSQLTHPQPNVAIGASYSLILPAMGYILASSVALYISVRGIMKGKSILIFPYLVVIILEMIVSFIFYLWGTILLTPLFLISLVLTIAINLYVFLCLWSLYKEITDYESDAVPILPMSFSNDTVSMQKHT